MGVAVSCTPMWHTRETGMRVRLRDRYALVVMMDGVPKDERSGIPDIWETFVNG